MGAGIGTQRFPHPVPTVSRGALVLETKTCPWPLAWTTKPSSQARGRTSSWGHTFMPVTHHLSLSGNRSSEVQRLPSGPSLMVLEAEPWAENASLVLWARLGYITALNLTREARCA